MLSSKYRLDVNPNTDIFVENNNAPNIAIINAPIPNPIVESLASKYILMYNHIVDITIVFIIPQPFSNQTHLPKYNSVLYF